MVSRRRTGTDYPPTSSRKHLRALVGAAVLFGLCASISDASAQFAYGYTRIYPGPYYDEPMPIPPRAVVYRLQERGFTEISRPRFDGSAYIVDATSPIGSRVRLFLDAHDGAVFGRQRLDTPYYPSNRVARAAPGYGWTEEDFAPRRRGRDAARPVPPPDVSPPHPQAAQAPTEAARPALAAATPDSNPLGVNPDAKGAGRSESRGRATTAAPRKTARLTTPAKPSAPPAAPAAPAPKDVATEQAAPRTEPAPDAGKAAPEKAETAPATPVSAEPPVAERPAEPQADAKPVAEKPEIQAKAPNQDWQEPPTSEAPKRNVRVIDGATVVPGGEPATTGTN